MTLEQRRIVLHTAGKKYAGAIDVGARDMRSIDIFNSAAMYWRDPAEKGFEDAILMRNAQVVLEGGVKLGEYNKIQVKLSNVVFFYDGLESAGTDNEKLRAAKLKSKTREQTSQVQITTHTRGQGFYLIKGIFYGLFKSKSKNRFIPLTDVSVHSVNRHGDKWQKSEIKLDNRFIGVSVDHIETCTFA